MAAPPAFLNPIGPRGGVIRATTVALGPRALAICGPSGAGKTRLALGMIALGAALVADDLTEIVPGPDGAPLARFPAAAGPALRGVLEARGLGLIVTDPAPPTPLAAILDLGAEEPARLPPCRRVTILDRPVTLLRKTTQTDLAAALILYLRHDRLDPDNQSPVP